MPIDIKAKLDELRTKLLDLTNRNRLLNFRLAKRRSVQIFDELPNQVYQRLVNDELGFYLKPLDEEANVAALPDNGELTADLDLSEPDFDNAPHHNDDQLQTHLKVDKLETTLKHISREARSCIEETGVNPLYLALGFLEWFESKDSNEKRLAPLVLVPVTLERARFDARTKTYRYKLVYDGEDITPNVSLREKLRMDFHGLNLPELEDSEPADYLREVQKTVRRETRWKVTPQIALGFFSFSKIRMYLDLDAKNWPDAEGDGNALLDHRLIKDIFEGREGASNGCPTASEHQIDDNEVAEKIPLVVDADSSQHSALVDAVAGKNLVIEGPPGTGKSQTITNLIAAALYEGKSILFVAEKLAALEVVRANLDRVGLGDFCLELHSHKARKQVVYADIKRRLEMTFSPVRQLGLELTRLNTARKKLDAYVKACQRVVGPKGETVFSVFGKITQFRVKGIKRLEISPDVSIDGQRFDESVEAMDELGRHILETGSPSRHPWRGFLSHNLYPGDEDQVLKFLNEFDLALINLAKTVDEIFHKSEIVLAQKLTDLEELKRESLFPLREIPKIWVQSVASAQSLPQARESLAKLQGKLEEYRQAFESAAKVFNKSNPASQELWVAISEKIPGLCRLTLSQLSFADCLELKLTLDQAISKIEKVVKSAELHRSFGVPDESLTPHQFAVNCVFLKLIAAAPPTADGDLNEGFFAHDVSEVFKTAAAEYRSLKDAREKLDELFSFQDLPPPEMIPNIRRDLRVHGGRLHSFFLKAYRDARKRVLIFLRDRKMFRFPDIVQALERLEKNQSRCAAFQANEIFSKRLGCQFSGLETNWKRIEKQIIWCGKVREFGGNLELTKVILSRLNSEANVSAKLTQHEEQLSEVKEILLDLGRRASSLVVQDADNSNLSAVLAVFRERRNQLSQFIELVEPHLASVNITIETIAKAATEMLAAAKLHSEIESAPDFQELSGNHFAGIQTDHLAIDQMLRWVEKVHAMGLGNETIAWMLVENSASDRAGFLFEKLNNCLDELATCEKALRALKDYGEINISEFLGGITTSPFTDVSKQIAALKKQFHLLPAWANYSRSVDRAKQFGLSPFVSVASSGEVSGEQLGGIYSYAFYNTLVREAIHQSPILAEFSRISHESVRDRFQRIDCDLKALRQREIAHRIGSNQQLPAGISTGPVSQRTEMGFIVNEIGKQKRHAPIRLLIHRAGEALAVLKPCFMMSPLSAAQFLAPGVRAFDMVVMDEASQLKPEDALGAIARTGQLVVVGDPKQLPPTTFFDKMADEENENDDATAADDAESILEVCMKVYAPMRRLRWHYRSEHESLIAFSNHAFYDRDLIVFPSATSDDGRLGVRFHRIENGAYVKGRNLPEAEKIAKAIIAHAQQHPNESLGVGAFNTSQKELIEESLDRICRNDGAAREAVDKLSAHPEKLFVKNLENLQGDQRDVIFISCTFGPDPETKRVFQRFGPINSENGWRRLNVMFTRAKKRMEVFSSMSPEDIIGGPSVKRGVNDFKRFLEYASTGRIIDPGEITGRTPDSDFEMAVAETVRSMGFQVRPQVGVAGFYIDIAVLKPNRPDEFILGIECDGATYHSAKSARDRDRLREEILRRRGWNIHRIWSTDWFKNQTAETTRLKETLERLSLL